MVKIVYQDGDIVRALKGTLIAEDPFFVTISHNMGEIRVGKQFIIKIEGTSNDTL